MKTVSRVRRYGGQSLVLGGLGLLSLAAAAKHDDASIEELLVEGTHSSIAAERAATHFLPIRIRSDTRGQILGCAEHAETPTIELARANGAGVLLARAELLETVVRSYLSIRRDRAGIEVRRPDTTRLKP
jgi:hypothetical protein